MPFSLPQNIEEFPPVHFADEEGLLAFGGTVEPEHLLKAYPKGIFPWYNEGQPVLWWAPAERCVLYPALMHCSKNVKRYIRNNRFEVKMDSAFHQVVQACSYIGDNRKEGTWLNQDLRKSLAYLHDIGLAHSIEAWQDGELVGGLYGVSIGGMFFGESMFAAVPDASKVSLYYLCQWMLKHDMDLIDCQIPNEHLMRLGAQILPPEEFYPLLEKSVERPNIRGPWKI